MKRDETVFTLTLVYPKSTAIQGLKHDLKRLGRVFGLRARVVAYADGPLDPRTPSPAVNSASHQEAHS